MSISLIPHFGLDRQYRYLKDELLEATDLALKDGILMNGYYTERFESWLRERTKCKYATVVHSGTQALELIAKAVVNMHHLSINNKPPTIRVPNLTYVATLNSMVNAGCEIAIDDTDKHGLKLDVPGDRFDTYQCIVGLYGAPIIVKHKHSVIVDGAQHWLVAGEHTGLGMAISFDPTKNLPSSGNGGAVVTNDAVIYDYVERAKNNGKLYHYESGTNSKMSELECAHILVRTKYLDDWQKRRETIRKYYLEQFIDMPFTCLSRGFTSHSDQKFVIYTSDRDYLQTFLHDNNIEAKVHYDRTLSELPIAKQIDEKPDFLSTSVMLSRGVLSLPIYPELTDSEVEIIADKVKEYYT